MVELRHLCEQVSTVERRLDAPAEMIERIIVHSGDASQKASLRYHPVIS
jgi:hypothetical protein